MSALTEEKVFHVIYTLWLGGLIVRDDWQPAFDRRMISMFKTTKLSLKREAKMPGVVRAGRSRGVRGKSGLVDEACRNLARYIRSRNISPALKRPKRITTYSVSKQRPSFPR